MSSHLIIKRNENVCQIKYEVFQIINALFVNTYLFLVHQNFPKTDADIIQVLRFFIGDMVGAAIVFAMLTIFLRPILVVKR